MLLSEFSISLLKLAFVGLLVYGVLKFFSTGIKKDTKSDTREFDAGYSSQEDPATVQEVLSWVHYGLNYAVSFLGKIHDMSIENKRELADALVNIKIYLNKPQYLTSDFYEVDDLIIDIENIIADNVADDSEELSEYKELKEFDDLYAINDETYFDTLSDSAALTMKNKELKRLDIVLHIIKNGIKPNRSAVDYAEITHIPKLNADLDLPPKSDENLSVVNVSDKSLDFDNSPLSVKDITTEKINTTDKKRPTIDEIEDYLKEVELILEKKEYAPFVNKNLVMRDVEKIRDYYKQYKKSDKNPEQLKVIFEILPTVADTLEIITALYKGSAYDEDKYMTLRVKGYII